MKGFNKSVIKPFPSVFSVAIRSEPTNTFTSKPRIPSSPPLNRTLPSSSSNKKIQTGTSGAGVGELVGETLGNDVGEMLGALLG